MSATVEVSERADLPSRETGSGFAQLRSWTGNQKRHFERWYWALPAALAFVLTIMGASRPMLWRDELTTWGAAERSWSQLWKLLGNMDAVAAPYYIFMHGWVRLFGDSELSLRAPSILAVTATAALIAVLGRRLYSTRVGLLASMVADQRDRRPAAAISADVPRPPANRAA